MRYKITKAEFDKLSDDMKAEYKSSGDGYVLEVEGLDTKAAEKFEAERGRRRAAEKERDDAKAKVDELEDKFSDTAATLKKGEDAKVKAEGERDEARKVHTDYVRKTVLEKEAEGIANELSKSAPKVLLPHIMNTLDVDMTDPSAPKLVYKDKDGKAGAKRDDVLKNFRDNKDFGAIMTVSQSSGGRTSQQQTTNGNGHTGPKGNNPPSSTPRLPGERVDVNALSPAEMVARVNARRVAAGEEAL